MARAKGPADPAVKHVIDAYHVAYLARHDVKPLINGPKDGDLVKKMLATWGEATVLQLVVEFVGCNEPMAVRMGWTIAALWMVAPRLLTKRNGPDERTAGNMDAAMRATRRK